MSPRPQLITAEQAAEVLAESMSTLRRNTRRGDYKAFAVNLSPEGQRPKWRYDLHRLQRWIDTHRAA